MHCAANVTRCAFDPGKWCAATLLYLEKKIINIASTDLLSPYIDFPRFDHILIYRAPDKRLSLNLQWEGGTFHPAYHT